MDMLSLPYRVRAWAPDFVHDYPDIERAAKQFEFLQRRHRPVILYERQEIAGFANRLVPIRISALARMRLRATLP